VRRRCSRHREYQPRGFEVLAVNLDEERRSAESLLSAHPHRMTVLFDPKVRRRRVRRERDADLLRHRSLRHDPFTDMGYSGNVDVSYRKEIAQLLAEP
jgi:hypothetical protein